MIAEFGDDTRPKVARHDGKVAIFAYVDGLEHGFLLDDRATVDTAVKMLGAVADLRGDDAFSHAVDGMTFKVITIPGAEPEGMLTFRFNGAPVSVRLDPIQVAELAAAFAQATVFIDGPLLPPRRDR